MKNKNLHPWCCLRIFPSCRRFWEILKTACCCYMYKSHFVHFTQYHVIWLSKSAQRAQTISSKCSLRRPIPTHFLDVSPRQAGAPKLPRSAEVGVGSPDAPPPSSWASRRLSEKRTLKRSKSCQKSFRNNFSHFLLRLILRSPVVIKIKFSEIKYLFGNVQLSQKLL